MAEIQRMPMPGRLRDWSDRLREWPAREVDIVIALAVCAATAGPTLAPVPQPWWIVGLALLASVPGRVWRPGPAS